jgi:hypothetical protein
MCTPQLRGVSRATVFSQRQVHRDEATWWTEDFPKDGVLSTPGAISSLISGIEKTKGLISKGGLRLLPTVIQVWYLREQRTFRVASKLPPGSRCLLDWAKEDRAVAHRILKELLGYVDQLSEQGIYNMSITARHVYYSPREAGTITLVDWKQTLIVGRRTTEAFLYQNLYRSKCMCSLLSTETYAVLWAMADVNETAYFRNWKGPFLVRHLPSEIYFGDNVNVKRLMMRVLVSRELLGHTKLKITPYGWQTRGFGYLLHYLWTTGEMMSTFGKHVYFMRRFIERGEYTPSNPTNGAAPENEEPVEKNSFVRHLRLPATQ